MLEIKNLRGKVIEAERKRKGEEELREQLEKNGEILAQAVEGAAALDNMLDGIENKEETNRSLSAELDPMDMDIGDEKTDLEEEFQDAFGLDYEEEVVKDKNEVKRPISSPEEEIASKSKVNKLGLPEASDRVWVKLSETNETENYEVISLRDPLDPEKVRFNCRKLDDKEKRVVEVNFLRSEWGYLTPTDDKGSPPFFGYSTPKKSDLPPIPPRGLGIGNKLKKESVIKKTNNKNRVGK